MAQHDKKFQVEGAEALIRAALEQLDADDTHSLSEEDTQVARDLLKEESDENSSAESLHFENELQIGEQDDEEDSILHESLDHLASATDFPEQEWEDLENEGEADDDGEERGEFLPDEFEQGEVKDFADNLLPPSSASDQEQFQAELKALQEELDAERRMRLEEEEKSKGYYESFVRVSADLENLRKRNNREKAEMKKYGHESTLRDLLPVLDNFERAMDTTFGQVPDSLREGIDMIYRQFLNVFEKQGAERFDSRGVPFDYTLHEAISVEMTNEVPPDHVYKEFQAGYKLHDRLLRPAMVVVAKPLPEPPAEEEESEADPEETQEHAIVSAEGDQEFATEAEDSEEGAAQEAAQAEEGDD